MEELFHIYHCFLNRLVNFRQRVLVLNFPTQPSCSLSLLKIILSFTAKFFIYFRKGEVIFPFDTSLAFRGRDGRSRFSEKMSRVLSPSACIHSIISIPGLQKQEGKCSCFQKCQPEFWKYRSHI